MSSKVAICHPNWARNLILSTHAAAKIDFQSEVEREKRKRLLVEKKAWRETLSLIGARQRKRKSSILNDAQGLKSLHVWPKERDFFAQKWREKNSCLTADSSDIFLNMVKFEFRILRNFVVFGGKNGSTEKKHLGTVPNWADRLVTRPLLLADTPPNENDFFFCLWKWAIFSFVDNLLFQLRRSNSWTKKLVFRSGAALVSKPNVSKEFSSWKFSGCLKEL